MKRKSIILSMIMCTGLTMTGCSQVKEAIVGTSYMIGSEEREDKFKPLIVSYEFDYTDGETEDNEDNTEEGEIEKQIQLDNEINDEIERDLEAEQSSEPSTESSAEHKNNEEETKPEKNIDTLSEAELELRRKTKLYNKTGEKEFSLETDDVPNSDKFIELVGVKSVANRLAEISNEKEYEDDIAEVLEAPSDKEKTMSMWTWYIRFKYDDYVIFYYPENGLTTSMYDDEAMLLEDYPNPNIVDEEDKEDYTYDGIEGGDNIENQ